jgi:hypothetical protein
MADRAISSQPPIAFHGGDLGVCRMDIVPIAAARLVVGPRCHLRVEYFVYPPCLHHDLDEMYQLMGIPQQQTVMVQQLGLFNRHMMAWSSFGFMVPFLGYLLFIRSYFRRT